MLKLGLFEVAFFFAYRYGMSFSHATASPFWFPDSVLLVALLLSPPDRWWAFVLATLPVRLFTSVPAAVPIWFLLATFVIDSAKGLVTAGILRRCLTHPTRLESVREYALFCLVAVFAVPAVSAVAGASVRHSLGHAFWPAWQQWFMGNAMTHLIVTPAIFYWCLELPRKLRTADPSRWTEGALLSAGLLATGSLAFGHGSASAGHSMFSLFAPVPFLFWAAVRFGMFGATGGIALLAGLAVTAALEGRGPFAAQAPGAVARGLQDYLLLRAAPLYLVAILIEQERGVRRALRESEARFLDLAESAPFMIWMSGTDRRRSYFNRRWREITGHARETGESWTACLHPDDRERTLAAYRSAVEEHQPFNLEYRVRRHDGSYQQIVDHGIPRSTAQGVFLGYVGSCEEPIDRAAAGTAEVELPPIDLAHANRVATMGQLAAALAHEINQPLGAILRNAEAAELILQQEPIDHAELRAILSDIRQDDQRAGAVIDRMRSMLKRRTLEFEPLRLDRLVDDVAALLRNEMLTRRATLVIDLPADIPLVRGDRVHLQQVLINLLVNGADALDGARSEDRRVGVHARLVDGHTVEVAVHDTGAGIAEAHLPRLFEPFFTTKANGMGMGMSIAKAIVESHGGRIWVENNHGPGATACFTLTVADPRAAS